MKLNTTKKRILSLLLASLMLVNVFGALTAEAASKIQLDSNSGTHYLSKKKNENSSIVNIYGIYSVSQVKNIKSSNPTVATASVGDYSGIVLSINAKKTGTTTISCTANGKTLKYKLTVCKYVNPFKKLMVGDQDYASKFKKQTNGNGVKNPGTPVTLKVTPKNGWKLKKITGRWGMGKTKKLKNGQTIDPNKYYWIKFTFQNKKTKVIEEFDLSFDDIE